MSSQDPLQVHLSSLEPSRSLESRAVSSPRAARLSTLLLGASGLAAAGWIKFLLLLAHSRARAVASLFPADAAFTDFYLYKPTFERFHTAGFFDPPPPTSRFAYPALVAPLYEFFYSHQHRLSWYLLSTALLYAALLIWVAALNRTAKLDARGTLALVASAMLSFPALFLLERGNLELFVWAAAAAGSFFFAQRRPYLAAACFGLAAALKLYPILLLGLFLSEKRGFRSIAVGLGVAIASTFGALWYAGPSVTLAFHGFLGGVTGFQQHYGATVRTAELRFDHSFFSLWKVLSSSHPEELALFSKLYYVVCGLIFVVLFFTRVIRLPGTNRVLFLSAAMIVLPPVSYEYTLVHLYVPLLLILASAYRLGLTATGQIALLCALALLLPINLVVAGGAFQAGQIQSLVLLILAGCATLPLLKPTESPKSSMDRC